MAENRAREHTEDSPAGQPAQPVNRRRVLALGAAAAAGALALTAGRSDQAEAATGDPLILGQANTADQTTELSSTADPALLVDGSVSAGSVSAESISAGSVGAGSISAGSVGVGGPLSVFGAVTVTQGSVLASTAVGPAIEGRATAAFEPSGPGILGISRSGPAVEGRGFFGPGVLGTTDNGNPGVDGRSNFGHGVHGTSASTFPDVVVAGVRGENSGAGPGVHGTSSSGPGVLGQGNSTGAGLRGENAAGGFALQVMGTAQFQGVAGSGTIPAKGTSASISNPAVTAQSHITITLMGDPGNNNVQLWVERQPGSGFVLHTTIPLKNTTPFTYLIVEP